MEEREEKPWIFPGWGSTGQPVVTVKGREQLVPPFPARIPFSEGQGGEAVAPCPGFQLLDCPGNGDKLLSLGNTLRRFGQPGQWQKHQFKSVFTELCLHSLRQQLCPAVVLMGTECPKLEQTHWDHQSRTSQQPPPVPGSLVPTFLQL